MKPETGSKDQSGDRIWKRFNDEIFSLQACPDANAEQFVSRLAAEGVELIVDARRDDARAPDLTVDCEEAGVYYVPAVGGSGQGRSTEAAARYAKLAMRHKTCFVVDAHSDELLSLVTEQIPFTAVPLHDDADSPASAV